MQRELGISASHPTQHEEDMTESELRAKFEAWAEPRGYSLTRTTDSYLSKGTRSAWRGFKAAYALLAPEMREWQPIETAPEGDLVVVLWMDPTDPEHPERYDFDYLEDGVWVKHAENYEYFVCVAPPGSRGPSEKAPYTHWLTIPKAPAIALQSDQQRGDRRKAFEAAEAYRGNDVARDEQGHYVNQFVQERWEDFPDAAAIAAMETKHATE